MAKEHEARSIVVGVDGSDDALNAARWAAGLADWLGEPLHLVHAMRGAEEALLVLTVAGGEDAGRYPRELGQAVLDRAADAVGADFPTVRILRTLSHRSPTDALVEFSARARWVVLACTDLSAGGVLLVGSTTLAVATHAACPVIAWRGEPVARDGRPVVVGVDEAQIAQPALETAFEFADFMGVGVTVVYALPSRRAAGEVDIPILIDWEALEATARQRLTDVVSPFSHRWPDVEVSYAVEMGRASRAILKYASGAQLVVVGSRGRGGLAGVLLGSTGLSLLHHSPVPVAICPASAT